MEKELYYYVNYEKEITAIGEIDAPYMTDRGYEKVTQEEYEIKKDEFYKKNKERLEHLKQKHLLNTLK